MKNPPGAVRYEQPLPMGEIVVQLAELLRDKKARDILVIDLQELTSITDYFVIATANSTVQIKALVRSIEEFMDSFGIQPFSKDHSFDSPWVLIDYNHFVVHLFLQEGRDYYQLEKLWSDAPILYSDEGGIL